MVGDVGGVGGDFSQTLLVIL